MESTLVNNLLNSDCFPHKISKLSVIETHIAWLIKTGTYVYKIKKPVNFGFLDFTTLEQRKFYCEEEVRLNQRMSSDLYLDVVTIAGPESAPQVTECDEPIEYAVRLRQFESGQLLSELLEKHKFNPEWLDQLSEQIAEFHLAAPIVAPGSPWGAPEAIAEVVEDNYRHIDRTLLDEADTDRLNHLWDLAKQRFSELSELMATRKKTGFVRECHGDLHLGNITLDEGRLLVFDCIEFNKEFRWIDRIQDLAFLLMDLEANGQYRWANRCLNHYLEITGDYEGLKLLPSYKAHRAMVRAKVAMLGEKPDYPAFKHYLSLTEVYTQPPIPELIMMHGISGSGKSYLSSELAQRIGGVRVRSDIERKKIYREASLKGEIVELYGSDMNTRTFLKLSEVADCLLRSGQTVILDATFIRERTRRHFIELANKLGRPVRLLSCNAPESLILERLALRKELNKDPSDADDQVMLAQRASQNPLTTEELEMAVSVDTSLPDSLDRVLAYLGDQDMLPTALN